MASHKTSGANDTPDGPGYYTFEWVCENANCADRGQIHRKRIWARRSQDAKAGAKSIGIPPEAKLIEEEEQGLLRRILW